MCSCRSVTFEVRFSYIGRTSPTCFIVSDAEDFVERWLVELHDKALNPIEALMDLVLPIGTKRSNRIAMNYVANRETKTDWFVEVYFGKPMSKPTRPHP